MIPRFLERFALDFFLVAMPYTLLEQEGLEELEMCAERGISVVIGAPYASGILARGPQPGALYRYAPAAPEIIAKAERIAAVCQRHDVPLPPLRCSSRSATKASSAVIPGPVATEEVRTEPRLDAPRYSRCAVGRAEGRRADPRGRADAAPALDESLRSDHLGLRPARGHHGSTSSITRRVCAITASLLPPKCRSTNWRHRSAPYSATHR